MRRFRPESATVFAAVDNLALCLLAGRVGLPGPGWWVRGAAYRVRGQHGGFSYGMRYRVPQQDPRTHNNGSQSGSPQPWLGLGEVGELGVDGEFGGGPEDGVYVGVDGFDDLARGGGAGG